MLGSALLNGQRPFCAMETARAPLIVFSLDEIGQQFLVGPSGRTLGCPFVVVRTIAADIDHCVHGRTAAKNLAAWQVDAPTAKCRLRLRRIVPVECRLEELRERHRRMNLRCIVHWPRLNERHLDSGVLAQAARKDASCGTTANNYVVISTLHFAPP